MLQTPLPSSNLSKSSKGWIQHESFKGKSPKYLGYLLSQPPLSTWWTWVTGCKTPSNTHHLPLIFLSLCKNFFKDQKFFIVINFKLFFMWCIDKLLSSDKRTKETPMKSLASHPIIEFSILNINLHWCLLATPICLKSFTLSKQRNRIVCIWGKDKSCTRDHWAGIGRPLLRILLQSAYGLSFSHSLCIHKDHSKTLSLNEKFTAKGSSKSLENFHWACQGSLSDWHIKLSLAINL